MDMNYKYSTSGGSSQAVAAVLARRAVAAVSNASASMSAGQQAGHLKL